MIAQFSKYTELEEKKRPDGIFQGNARKCLQSPVQLKFRATNYKALCEAHGYILCGL